MKALGKFNLLLISTLIFGACSNTDNLKEDNIDLSGITKWNAPAAEKKLSDVNDSFEEVKEHEDLFLEKAYDDRKVANVEVNEKNIDKVHDYYYEYKVSKGDTLMLIAFKIYGDYRMWKHLKEWNEKIVFSENLKKGSIVFYRPPNRKINPPVGKAYLISENESLSKISKKLYQDYKYWPFLYENNQYFIRDPKLIFPGFTIYYKNKKSYQGRKPASVDTRPVFERDPEMALEKDAKVPGSV